MRRAAALSKPRSGCGKPRNAAAAAAARVLKVRGRVGVDALECEVGGWLGGGGGRCRRRWRSLSATAARQMWRRRGDGVGDVEDDGGRERDGGRGEGDCGDEDDSGGRLAWNGDLASKTRRLGARRALRPEGTEGPREGAREGTREGELTKLTQTSEGLVRRQSSFEVRRHVEDARGWAD